jgi:hypothetical protein
MLIKNFGILWERKYIHFGSQGVRGCMIGSIGNIEVDFIEQIGIYILYDKDMKPVYVGQAGNGKASIFSRLKQHERDQLWNRWDYVSWYGFRGTNSDGSLSKKNHVDKQYKINGSNLLNEIEGLLIKVLEPKLNKQGAKWTDVDEFFQEIHEDVEECTLDDLMEKHELLEYQIKELIQKHNK